MRRAELEHLIRAAAAVTNEYEIVVIGSQSIPAARIAALPVDDARKARLQGQARRLTQA